MLFGYVIVRDLLVVGLFSVLPPRFRRIYPALSNRTVRPFNKVNYWGSRAGATVDDRRRMGSQMDRVINSLERHLQASTETDLATGMHSPTSWDPFLGDYLTLRQLYHYPTQLFDFHHAQLTLGDAGSSTTT